MEKHGMVASQRTPCDFCGKKAVAVIGGKVRCEDHVKSQFEKTASVEQAPLKAFTEPLPGHAEG